MYRVSHLGPDHAVSNTKFLQLMDQRMCSVLPSFYYSFMTLSDADFKCSVKLPSQGIQSSTYGLCNESSEVLLTDLHMSHFQDSKHYLISIAYNSAPRLSVLPLSSMDAIVKCFLADNILIAIIYNCAIPLHNSASVSRKLHNQGVESAIQNYFYSSLIPHFTSDTQLTV